MIETRSRGSFNLDQTKHVQDGGWMGEEASAQKTQNWGYYEVKCLVETSAEEGLES